MTTGSSSDCPAATRPDTLDQVRTAYLLQDVPGGARHDRVEQGFVVVERGQHQALQLGHLRTEIAADLDAGAVGQTYVEDGDVGRAGGHTLERLCRRSGFTDDLEIVGTLQQFAHATTDHLVVIEQKHPDHDRTRDDPRCRDAHGHNLAAPGHSLIWMPSRFEFAGAKQLLRLLDAVMAIGSEQTLADALRRITETAADFVDAKYAALGVLDESGSRLAEFITVGLDEEETLRIGARPEGHGILGLLILEPKPLRLPDLHAHPDSFGFPPGHPPMTSFLGVPIRLRGVVYGNLYLTDKADGQVFTDVDQELAVGLAAAAGLAIENARLHEQARSATPPRPGADRGQLGATAHAGGGGGRRSGRAGRAAAR